MPLIAEFIPIGEIFGEALLTVHRVIYQVVVTAQSVFGNAIERPVHGAFGATSRRA
jgi:hypothetical protein